MRFWFIATILVLSCSASSIADTGADNTAIDNNWNATTRERVLTNAEKALGSYIFAKTVPALRSAIEKSRAMLVAISNPNQFALAVTKVLYAAAHDKHIFVEYSAEPVPQSVEPTPAEIAQAKQETEYDDYSYDVSARLHGNIGYLWIDGFDPLGWSKGMFDGAMRLLAHTDALIIDLRGNGGGRPDTVDYLLGYFFDKPTQITGFLWRKGGKVSAERRFTARVVEGPRYLHRPVYILIDDQTISGGEQFAYDMKVLHRAELVGKATAGGANIGDMVPLTTHFAMFVPVGTARNPYTGTNWEGVGVAPDLDAPSKGALLLAYVRALKAATDPLAESAEVRARALKDPARALAESLPAR